MAEVRHIGWVAQVFGKERVVVDLDNVVQRNSDVISAEADSDIVMVSLVNGLYYGVSDVGREIWEAIEEPKTVAQLVADLAGTYDIDADSCMADTLGFLNTLLDEKLIVIRQ